MDIYYILPVIIQEGGVAVCESGAHCQSATIFYIYILHVTSKLVMLECGFCWSLSLTTN